jgi:7-keto-8-aminopelargonate synthetase-like enzyme
MKLDKAPNTSVIINKVEHLYFSGTSYLGVSNLPDFHKILYKNIQKWGSSYGSSRNANIKLCIYEKAEKLLSEMLSTEDCITVSSGTFAGLLTLSTLENIVDSFFYMPKTHPAVLPKKALPFFEEKNLNSKLLDNKKETICIVADAIATLETEPYNFNILNKISSKKKILLLLDESHSLGVLGKNGNGIFSKLNLHKNIELIGVSSLTKAFSVNGGIIYGRKKTMNLIRKKTLFVGSAPMNPAFLESLINSRDLYINQLKKLQENCVYVYEKIYHLEKIKISKNYPVFFIDNENIADFLLSKKIIITSFYYPTLNNKKINRIVINANHTKKDLNYLCETLFSY